MEIKDGDYIVLIALMLAAISYIRSVPIKELYRKFGKNSKWSWKIDGQILILSVVQILFSVLTILLLLAYLYNISSLDSTILYTILSLAVILFIQLFYVLARNILKSLIKFICQTCKSNPATNSISKIQKGQTIEEVENLLSSPERTISFEDKVIYSFSGIKVIFKDGIVENVN